MSSSKGLFVLRNASKACQSILRFACADHGNGSVQGDSEAIPALKQQQTSSAASLSDNATAEDECFREDESDDGFKFSGIPIPPRSRPASEDLASRLAILR